MTFRKTVLVPYEKYLELTGCEIKDKSETKNSVLPDNIQSGPVLNVQQVDDQKSVTTNLISTVKGPKQKKVKLGASKEIPKGALKRKWIHF